MLCRTGRYLDDPYATLAGPGEMSGTVLDLSALRDAIESLEDGLAVVNDTHWFAAQNPKVRNTLIAGVIKNFEFVYEIGIKMIKRRIELDSLTPGEADQANFRDLLRTAGEKGLVADVASWFDYRKLRNVTAHTYDRIKAAEVYKDLMKFTGNARLLLERLEAVNV